MESLQDVWDFILERERCVVFGNLSRYPDLFLDATVRIPLLRIVVVVPADQFFSSKDPRVHVQRPGDPVERCDVLLYVEPLVRQPVDKPPLASRAVVLASHYAFKLVDPDRWVNVSYFHEPDPDGTRELMARQDFPVDTDDVGLLEGEHDPSIKIWGKEGRPPEQPHTYVIVDLTRFHQDALPLYLAYWDAFDYLLRYRSRVDRWIPVFSEKGHRTFRRFAQNVLDALFCRTYRHGNVREPRQLVALLPFYQSGTLDRTFDVPISLFGGIPFVAPPTLEEACKVATMHDVVPIAQNVLWIRS